MACATVTLSVKVTLDVPEEWAGQLSYEDLEDMAREACPDTMERLRADVPSLSRRGGWRLRDACRGCPPSSVQVIMEDDGQEVDGEPVMADVFVQHDFLGGTEIEFKGKKFIKADPSCELRGKVLYLKKSRSAGKRLSL